MCTNQGEECEIWGSHSGVTEDSSPVECYALLTQCNISEDVNLQEENSVIILLRKVDDGRIGVPCIAVTDVDISHVETCTVWQLKQSEEAGF
jgi:hypothetical protein